MAGSATKPRPSDAIVMPSCAPASCRVRSDVDSSASRSTRVPSAAASSSLVRREPTSANSSATKKPLTANSTNERANAGQPVTRPARIVAARSPASRRDRRIASGSGPVSSTRVDPQAVHRAPPEVPALVVEVVAHHGDAPEAVEHEPGERLVLAVGRLEPGGVEHLVGVQRAGHLPRSGAVAVGREAGARTSYSSSISPTISSSTSSSVMMPAVPPYSSTTTARWLRAPRMSASTSCNDRVSGTTTTSDMSCLDRGGRAGRRGRACTVFTSTTPTMSSRSARYTGKRENPVAADRSDEVGRVLVGGERRDLDPRHERVGRGLVGEAQRAGEEGGAVSPIVPSSADASSSRDSSASDRTDSSSSFGSMPSRRTVQLAARFSSRISGPNTMP